MPVRRGGEKTRITITARRTSRLRKLPKKRGGEQSLKLAVFSDTRTPLFLPTSGRLQAVLMPCLFFFRRVKSFDSIGRELRDDWQREGPAASPVSGAAIPCWAKEANQSNAGNRGTIKISEADEIE